MNIMITGGLGFIGSALVRKILDSSKDTLLNIDNCTYASMPEALEGREKSKNYIFKKIDIGDFDIVNKEIKQFKPNKIFHLAAESHVDRSISDPSAFMKTNILGTFNILQSIKLLGSNLPNDFMFVHISTDEVFGSLGFRDESFTETSPYKPNSPYSASKASSDMLVRAWHKTYGIKTVITNCSNNYGPWQNPEKLIPKIIFNALDGNTIPIYGKGVNIRDWLHVNDHVDALIKASNLNRNFSRFNIGANQEISNIELTKLICNYLDNKVPKENSYFQQVEFVDDRLGHDLRYVINSKHISSTLNFKASYNLQDGIKETIEWYLKNTEWVRNKINQTK